MPPMEIPSPDEWVVNEDSVEVTTTIQGTSDPYRRFILKRNNKNYKGGTHKTRFYVGQHWIREIVKIIRRYI